MNWCKIFFLLLLSCQFAFSSYYCDFALPGQDSSCSYGLSEYADSSCLPETRLNRFWSEEYIWQNPHILKSAAVGNFSLDLYSFGFENGEEGNPASPGILDLELDSGWPPELWQGAAPATVDGLLSQARSSLELAKKY